MIDIENTISELPDTELNAITGGFADKNLGVCTGCTTIYLPSPFDPHPNSGGENPYLPGGIYHR